MKLIVGGKLHLRQRAGGQSETPEDLPDVILPGVRPPFLSPRTGEQLCATPVFCRSPCTVAGEGVVNFGVASCFVSKSFRTGHLFYTMNYSGIHHKNEQQKASLILTGTHQHGESLY